MGLRLKVLVLTFARASGTWQNGQCWTNGFKRSVAVNGHFVRIVWSSNRTLYDHLNRREGTIFDLGYATLAIPSSHRRRFEMLACILQHRQSIRK